jgi:hypothetical protein
MKRIQSLLVFWSILWTLAIPLIHTHPALAHGQGDGEHRHPPLIHAVFSADLPDEYDDHHHNVVTITRSSETPPGLLMLVSFLDLSHPEIDFSVLTLSSDRKMSKALLLCCFLWTAYNGPTSTTKTLVTRVPIASPALVLLSSSLSLRAPPLT